MLGSAVRELTKNGPAAGTFIVAEDADLYKVFLLADGVPVCENWSGR
ncbi:MAG: hypothetical protein IIY29_04135 [Firmicutes bacterium]|nr:hypothetical protein [Bacillota bacterium]